MRVRVLDDDVAVVVLNEEKIPRNFEDFLTGTDTKTVRPSLVVAVLPRVIILIRCGSSNCFAS